MDLWRNKSIEHLHLNPQRHLKLGLSKTEFRFFSKLACLIHPGPSQKSRISPQETLLLATMSYSRYILNIPALTLLMVSTLAAAHRIRGGAFKNPDAQATSTSWIRISEDGPQASVFLRVTPQVIPMHSQGWKPLLLPHHFPPDDCKRIIIGPWCLHFWRPSPFFLHSNPLDINLINTDSVPGMVERQVCCSRHWEYSNEKDSLCFCSMEPTF